jgi:ADP-ribosyl-[dinitrogen reductase] hydrolase
MNLKYEDLPNTGYVIDTMISSLWCFYNTDSFEDALIKVVNLAGDADTMGAVCGQIAGAYYGYSNIPDRWTGVIKDNDYIVKQSFLLYDTKQPKK